MLCVRKKNNLFILIPQTGLFFQVNFTDIVKFETFDRDRDYILEKSGIKELIKQKAKISSRRSSYNLTQEFIDELPIELFRKLIDLYLIDFKLFNYPLTIQSLHDWK